MRLRHKLLLANAGVAAVAAVLFWLAYAGARTVADEYVRLTEQTMPAMRALDEMRAAAVQLLSAGNELTFLGALRLPAAGAARGVERQEAEAAEMRATMRAYEAAEADHARLVARSSPGERELSSELALQGRATLRAAREFLARVEERLGGSGLLAARQRLEAEQGALLARLARVLEQERLELGERQALTARAIRASGRLVALAAAVTLLLLVGAGYALARAIAGPIGRLTEAAARVAAGDFRSLELPRRGDEIGRLADAFRRMTEELAGSEARARHLTVHDALTGLPNRVLLAERLAQALGRARRPGGGGVSVLCLGLDHFKEVNDTLGHAAGDQLLGQVADRLRDCARETDTVARLGGDEFAVLQVVGGGPGGGAHQAADAQALCRRLLESVEAPFRLDGQEVAVGVSAGVALAPADGVDAATLLKHADIALSRAKADGRGTFRFFEEVMNAELQARKALERDLRVALAEGQLGLHYQPLVELRTGRLAGAEALLRWRHPERGVVPPGEFVPLAEETGLIVPIGEWVLGAACAQAVAWGQLRVAVNLSPVQFRQRDLASAVARALADTGLEPGRLELEITEGVLLEDTEAALAALAALKGLGVRIAMDDFGTGYSSLSYLRRFPFDKIKIDRSFVADLGRSADAAAIVRSVVGLGSSLGMTTVAEGVEAAAQAELLLAEGCDEVQGYHFGRPVPAAEFAHLLPSHPGAAATAAATGPARAPWPPASCAA